MYNQRLQTIGFFVLLGIALLISFFMFLPFLELLALAGILAVLFKPAQQRIQRSMPSPSASALLTAFLVAVIVLIPLVFIGYVLYFEITNVYKSIASGAYSLSESSIILRLPGSTHALAQSFFADIGARLSSLATNAVQGVASLLANVANFFFDCLIVFFSLFYFLRDGDRLKIFFNRIFPLSEAHEVKLVDRVELAITGIVKGAFLMALIHGGAALAAFMVFGIPQPFLWAVLAVLAALVPTFGISLTMAVAVVFQLLSGHAGQAIGLAVWSVLVIPALDNLVGPRLIGGKAKLHPLLILFGVVGGLQLFGFFGFLLGPITMAVLMSLLEMYQSEGQK